MPAGKPITVCPSGCNGMMQKKVVVKPGMSSKHWGQIEAFNKLGDVDLVTMFCPSCGRTETYQLQKLEFEGFRKKKRTCFSFARSAASTCGPSAQPGSESGPPGKNVSQA